MKKIYLVLLLSLLVNINAQNYFPLQVGNYWRYVDENMFGEDGVTQISVNDSVTIKGQLYYNCHFSLSNFEFKYLRVDKETNQLIALKGETEYPIIDFDSSSQDTFYFPVQIDKSNPDSIIMGQIVKGGWRDPEGRNCLSVMFNPDTMMYDDEVHVNFEEGFGPYGIQYSSGFYSYSISEALVDGEYYNFSNSLQKLNAVDSDEQYSTVSKQILLRRRKISGEMLMLNGRNTNVKKPSRGIYVQKERRLLP